MSLKNKKYLTFLFLLPLTIYSFFGMIIISLVFSYLNQSSLTPKAEQLTFFNYLFPFLVTLGFVVYFPILIVKNLGLNSSLKNRIIRCAVLASLAAIAIPWQIEHISWQVNKKEIMFSETAPYLIGTIFTIGTLILELNRVRIHYNEMKGSR